MIKNEYFSEQTELLSRLLQTILFPQSSEKFDLKDYSFSGSAADLHAQLIQLVNTFQFNEAENLLYEAIEQDNGQESLQIAVWFYHHLNQLETHVLEQHGFSREEVLEGMQEIEKRAIMV